MFVYDEEWAEQPQVVAEVDWSNPLSRGLVFAAYGGGPDIISGTLPTYASGASRIPISDGVASASGAGNIIYVLPSGHKLYSITTTDTVFASERVNTVMPYGGLCLVDYRQTGGSPYIAWGYTSDNVGTSPQDWVAPDGSTFSDGQTASARIAAANKVSHGKVRTTTETRYFVDGNLVETKARAAITPDFVNKQPLAVGNAGSALSVLLIWDRPLSDQEYKTVHQNPWQLLAPQFNIIPLAGSGGLWTYDEEWGGIPQGAAEISDIGRLFTGIFAASGGSGSLLELVSGKYYGASTSTVGPSGAGIALNGAYFAAPLVLGDTFTRGFVSSGISQPPGSEGTLLFAGNLQFQVNSARLAVNQAFAFNYMNAVTDMTKPHCFVVVARPDYQCIFMDGALVASYPGSGGYSGSGGGFVAQFGNDTITGQLALAFDSPIAINLGLAAQISANPGLLFESQVSCIPTAQVVAYYPGSDISVAGWTASTGTDLFACVDETTFDDGDYITSPDSTTSTAMGWSNPVPAGAWSLAIRPMFPEGTSGQIRLVMLDSGNSAVGASAWQTLTGAFVTYTLAITTSGVSDRFRLEIQP